MQSKKRQKGMTMWGLLFVLGVLGAFMFLFLKLLPPYLTDMKVTSALASVGRQSDVGNMSKAEISEAIRKRLEIDNADNDIDLNKTLTLETRGRTKAVRIYYEAVVPMAFNVSALLVFDHTLEARSVE